MIGALHERVCHQRHMPTPEELELLFTHLQRILTDTAHLGHAYQGAYKAAQQELDYLLTLINKPD